MPRPKAARPEPKSEYQKRLDEGFTPEQARELVLAGARAGPQIVSGEPKQVITAIERQERGALGPDPEMVRRQQEAAANAVPPPPNVILTLDIEPRWAEIVTLYRDILRGQRNLPDLTDSQAMTQLIRWASANHPDILMVRSAGKGKATYVHPGAAQQKVG